MNPWEAFEIGCLFGGSLTAMTFGLWTLRRTADICVLWPVAWSPQFAERSERGSVTCAKLRSQTPIITPMMASIGGYRNRSFK